MNEATLIPIIFGNKIIATVPFEPNLNLVDKPYYLNQSCNMGLARIPSGTYKGRLVLMYEDEIHPSCNKGKLVSDNKAYELCVNRGKYSVVKKLNIKPVY